MVAYQIGALQAMARYAGLPVTHLKPHGALNNMAAVREDYALAIGRAIQAVDPDIIYVALTGLADGEGRPRARPQGGPRRLRRPRLRRRRQPRPRDRFSAPSTRIPEKALAQCLSMVKDGCLTSRDGKRVEVGRPDDLRPWRRADGGGAGPPRPQRARSRRLPYRHHPRNAEAEDDHSLTTMAGRLLGALALLSWRGDDDDDDGQPCPSSRQVSRTSPSPSPWASARWHQRRRRAHPGGAAQPVAEDDGAGRQQAGQRLDRSPPRPPHERRRTATRSCCPIPAPSPST